MTCYVAKLSTPLYHKHVIGFNSKLWSEIIEIIDSIKYWYYRRLCFSIEKCTSYYLRAFHTRLLRWAFALISLVFKDIFIPFKTSFIRCHKYEKIIKGFNIKSVAKASISFWRRENIFLWILFFSLYNEGGKSGKIYMSNMRNEKYSSCFIIL